MRMGAEDIGGEGEGEAAEAEERRARGAWKAGEETAGRGRVRRAWEAEGVAAEPESAEAEGCALSSVRAWGVGGTTQTQRQRRRGEAAANEEEAEGGLEVVDVEEAAEGASRGIGGERDAELERGLLLCAGQPPGLSNLQHWV